MYNTIQLDATTSKVNGAKLQYIWVGMGIFIGVVVLGKLGTGIKYIQTSWVGVFLYITVSIG